MTSIQPPPPLTLPEISSYSAPESRVHTPTPVKRRGAISKPTSPIAKKHTPIVSRQPPALEPSPTRATRRHRYHATFNAYNPRSNPCDAPCAVHSYVTAEQEISVLPSKSTGGVKFSEAPRIAPIRATCPVHVYAEAKSTLRQMGGTRFSTGRQGRDSFQQTTRALAPVHAYASPASTLRKAGGVAFGSTAPRTELLSVSFTAEGLISATRTPRSSVRLQSRVAQRRLPPPKLAPLPEASASKVKEPQPGAGHHSPREVEALF